MRCGERGCWWPDEGTGGSSAVGGAAISYPTPARSNKPALAAEGGSGRVLRRQGIHLAELPAQCDCLGQLFGGNQAQQRRHACGGIALGLMPPYAQMGAGCMHLPILSAQVLRDTLCVRHTRPQLQECSCMRFYMAVPLGSCWVFPPHRGLAPVACSTSVYPEFLADQLCARALHVLLCTFMRGCCAIACHARSLPAKQPSHALSCGMRRIGGCGSALFVPAPPCFVLRVEQRLQLPCISCHRQPLTQHAQQCTALLGLPASKTYQLLCHIPQLIDSCITSGPSLIIAVQAPETMHLSKISNSQKAAMRPILHGAPRLACSMFKSTHLSCSLGASSAAPLCMPAGKILQCAHGMSHEDPSQQ